MSLLACEGGLRDVSTGGPERHGYPHVASCMFQSLRNCLSLSALDLKSRVNNIVGRLAASAAVAI